MPSKSKTTNWDWQVRYTVILMCCAATFICYIDRVNISVAIIPMAEQYNWDLQTQGTVLSSYYVGYLLMQVMGGFLADCFGGKIVLGLGILLWSFFTIVGAKRFYHRLRRRFFFFPLEEALFNG